MDASKNDGSAPPPVAHPKRLEGTEALKTHATFIVALLLCALAFWFELRRAEGGNSLSWAYVFEWPLLGGFAIYMWWKFIHPEDVNASRTRRPPRALAPEYEGMLAAWEEHQQDLAASQANEGASPLETEPREPDL